MEENINNNSLLALLGCVKRRLVGMAVIFVAIVAVVVVTTFRVTPIYEISSRLLVKYGREYVYTSIDELKRGDVTPNYNYDVVMILNTEVEILGSRELADDVVEAIGINTLFPKIVEKRRQMSSGSSLPGLLDDSKASDLHTIAVTAFRNNLSVSHIKNSNVIGLSFEHPDPEVAVLAVRELIERFKERHLEIYKNPQIPFLELQVDRWAKELREAEEAKAKYKEDNMVYDLLVQREIFIQHYANFDALLVNEESLLEDFRVKMATLKDRLEQLPAEMPLFEETRQQANNEFTESKLLELRLEEHDLMDKFPADNRKLVTLQDRIKMVEEFLEVHRAGLLGGVRTGPNPIYQELEKELVIIEMRYEGQKEKVETIRASALAAKQQLHDLSQHEKEIKRLTDIEMDADRNFKSFRDTLAETRTQEVMDNEKLVNIVVIDKPQVPPKPIKPRKKLRLMVGLILGAAAALFYALTREYLLVSRE